MTLVMKEAPMTCRAVFSAALLCALLSWGFPEAAQGGGKKINSLTLIRFIFQPTLP
jgi:hypothetical protein